MGWLCSVVSPADIGLIPSEPEAPRMAPVWELHTQERLAGYLILEPPISAPGVFPIPWAIEQAYRNSNRVILLDDFRQIPELEDRLQALVRFTPAVPLSKRLPAQMVDQIQSLAKAAHISMQELSDFRTWSLANMLMASAYHQAGFRTGYSIGQRFFERAAKDAKPVIALETLEEGFQRMVSLPEAGQLHFLNMNLEAIRRIETDTGQMLYLWRSGNREGLAGIDRWKWERFGDVTQPLMRQVVDRYLEGALPLLQDPAHTELWVVDLVSVTFPQGVIARLEQAGFQLRQVEDRPPPVPEIIGGEEALNRSVEDTGVFGRLLAL